ncbi:hypothetical protein R1flu_001223 [Riccia fluitans]|uniref:Uncharacterized protein n=1 Tax=Riccia fluitans TaxID=41844 RepID=A0ABD1Y2V9_9MARC
MVEAVVYLVPISGVVMLLLIGAVTSKVRRCLACGRPDEQPCGPSGIFIRRRKPPTPPPPPPPSPPLIDLSFQTWAAGSPTTTAPPREAETEATPEPEVPQLPEILHCEIPRDFRRLRYSPTGDNDDEGEIAPAGGGSASRSYLEGARPSQQRSSQLLPQRPRETGEQAPASLRQPPRSVRTWSSAPPLSRRIPLSTPLRIQEPSTSPSSTPSPVQRLSWGSTSPVPSEEESMPQTPGGITISEPSTSASSGRGPAPDPGDPKGKRPMLE